MDLRGQEGGFIYGGFGGYRLVVAEVGTATEQKVRHHEYTFVCSFSFAKGLPAYVHACLVNGRRGLWGVFNGEKGLQGEEEPLGAKYDVK